MNNFVRTYSIEKNFMLICCNYHVSTYAFMIEICLLFKFFNKCFDRNNDFEEMKDCRKSI